MPTTFSWIFSHLWRNLMRLNRFIADCTGHSRRKADELIADGKVKVNRKVASVGQVIDPHKDTVVLDGKIIEAQRKVYLLFHKPKDVISTKKDPEGRKTIYDFLPEHLHHVDPVGRLDRDSSGLLLLSNDGDFVQQLTHPKYQHKKVYKVTTNKPLTEKILQKLAAGILLMPENQLAQATVEDWPEVDTVVLVLTTGLNRQIRRCFEALGYTVKGLKRIRHGNITLGHIKPGDFRPLKPSEVRALLPPKSLSTKRRPSSRPPESPKSGPKNPRKAPDRRS